MKRYAGITDWFRNRSELVTIGNGMREMIALGRSEAEVIRCGGDVKYYLSGSGHPHISTLKK